MKVELQGLWVDELSIVVPGASWREILRQMEKTFYFCFFLPGGDSCSGPQESRARVLVARRSEPLTARTAAKPSARGGKSLFCTQ